MGRTNLGNTAFELFDAAFELLYFEFEPDDEVYARIREESLWRNRIKSTAAETAIVSPLINETT